MLIAFRLATLFRDSILAIRQPTVLRMESKLMSEGTTSISSESPELKTMLQYLGELHAIPEE